MWARRPATPAFISAAMLLGLTTGALADGTGWFSPDQVSQGRWEYSQKCSVCHGAQLQGGGAPAVKGQVFEQQWNGKTLKDFYNYVHDQMPLGQARSLDPQEYADVVAYMLARKAACLRGIRNLRRTRRCSRYLSFRRRRPAHNRGDINKDEHERTTGRRSKRRTRRGVRPVNRGEAGPASSLAQQTWPVENVCPMDMQMRMRSGSLGARARVEKWQHILVPGMQSPGVQTRVVRSPDADRTDRQKFPRRAFPFVRVAA